MGDGKDDRVQTLRVMVKPRSLREGIEFGGGVVTVRVATPPVEGKSNGRVVELVAGALGIPRSWVRVEVGHKSRYKTLSVRHVGFDPYERLSSLFRDPTRGDP